jgi:rhodanese-related sulfurtransferase
MSDIDRTELQRRLADAQPPRLVLSLGPAAHAAAHIPGSETFADTAEALRTLHPDEPVVVYCSHAACASSRRTYRFLVEHGFTRVRRYPGGLADWAEAGLPLHEHRACPRRCCGDRPDTTRASHRSTRTPVPA